MLFDYVLHQINETCLATGVSEFTDDEIQPLATLLTLADAPEAFYISVKLGVQGIGEILRRSISDALDRYPNSERLNMVLYLRWISVLPSVAFSCFEFQGKYVGICARSECYIFFILCEHLRM